MKELHINPRQMKECVDCHTTHLIPLTHVIHPLHPSHVMHAHRVYALSLHISAYILMYEQTCLQDGTRVHVHAHGDTNVTPHPRSHKRARLHTNAHTNVHAQHTPSLNLTLISASSSGIWFG
jgi:hypothetical protein